ncbi:MAG: hypothetical protein KAT15_23215 [Bacteroidales bacterium]|nr:hypothetical protein [Bacteroidales bacterium]
MRAISTSWMVSGITTESIFSDVRTFLSSTDINPSSTMERITSSMKNGFPSTL